MRPDGTSWVWPNNIVPARIYIGVKGKMEDGKTHYLYTHVYKNVTTAYSTEQQETYLYRFIQHEIKK